MTPEEFKLSINETSPPSGLDPLLLALWYEAQGNWEKCHNIVQDINTKEAAMIHAYLHRKEGDVWNADYWYSRAGTKRSNASLEEEWSTLVDQLLR